MTKDYTRARVKSMNGYRVNNVPNINRPASPRSRRLGDSKRIH